MSRAKGPSWRWAWRRSIAKSSAGDGRTTRWPRGPTAKARPRVTISPTDAAFPVWLVEIRVNGRGNGAGLPGDVGSKGDGRAELSQASGQSSTASRPAGRERRGARSRSERCAPDQPRGCGRRALGADPRSQSRGARSAASGESRPRPRPVPRPSSRRPTGGRATASTGPKRPRRPKSNRSR